MTKWAALRVVAATALAAFAATGCGDDDDGGGATANPCIGQETDYGVVWCVPDDFEDNEYALYVDGGVVVPEKAHDASTEICQAAGNASRYSKEATYFVRDDLERIQVRRLMQAGEEGDPRRVGNFIFETVEWDKTDIAAGCQTIVLAPVGDGTWATSVVDALRE